MMHTKLLQQLIGMALVITLTGCITPAAPLESPTPTQVSTITPRPSPTSTVPRPSPTATLIQVSNFEECLKLLNRSSLIPGAYPRQCMYRGDVFDEPLEAGVIFARAYKRHGGRFGNFTTFTSDGGYLLTGGVDGSDVLKLNAFGEKEWEYKLGRKFIEKFSLENVPIGCVDARESSNGGYVVLVKSAKFGPDASVSPPYKFFTIELDREGKWVAAEAIANRAGKDAYLDSSGNFVWLTSLGVYLPGRVVETLDGSYAITGVINYSGGLNLFTTDPTGNFVWQKNLCLDKSIRQKWEKEIVCSVGNVQNIIQSQDGGYVLTGDANRETWLLKTDSQGSIEWIRSYRLGYQNGGHALLQLPDGGYLVAGSHILVARSHGSGMLLKTDSIGTLQWYRLFDKGLLNGRFDAIKQGSNNEIILSGNIEIDGFGKYNVWVIGVDFARLE